MNDNTPNIKHRSASTGIILAGLVTFAAIAFAFASVPSSKNAAPVSKPTTTYTAPAPKSAPAPKLSAYESCLKEMAFLDRTGGNAVRWCSITTP